MGKIELKDSTVPVTTKKKSLAIKKKEALTFTELENSTVPATTKKKALSMKKKEALTFYALVSPFFIIFVLMTLIPMVWGIYLSLTNYTGFNFHNLKFVGWRNYIRVFCDNDAMYALWRTFVIGIISGPLNIIACFFLALLLCSNIKGVGIYRTLFYLPAIVPAVATGLMWKIIYDNAGVLNNLLQTMGLTPISFLDYEHITTSLIIMMVWGCGGGILINIAGIKNIPVSLYEAADIDGATGFNKFRHILLPLYTPTLFYNVIMSVIGLLQIFSGPVLLSGNSITAVPIKPIYTYVVHAYQQVFTAQRFGYGTALLWVVSIISIFFTLIVFTTSKYWVNYEVEPDKKG